MRATRPVTGILTIILATICLVCFSLSLVGAYKVVQLTHSMPAEEPPVEAEEEFVIEEVSLPITGESPSEAIVEPVRVVEPELVVLSSCAIENDLEADPVPVEEPTPETVEEPPVRYSMTEQERAVVESVVMAESGGEPYEGQIAVAQCILNGCEELGMRPDEVVIEFQYTPNRPAPSESVQDAVSAVFDRGEVAVDDNIMWFYAPAGVDGIPWHESQRHVTTIGGHKFFAKWEG